MKNKKLPVLIFFLIMYSFINIFLPKCENEIIKTVILILFWGTVLNVLKLTHQFKEYGLKIGNLKDWRILILNLLVIFVIFFNILISLKSRYTPTPFEIIQLISCVFGEELFFRGIILSYFKKTFNKPALNIFIVSALFSFSHIINLFSQKSTIFIAVQLLFAFSLGLCLTAISYYSGSILLTVPLHFLINFTAVNTVEIYIFISLFILIPSLIIIKLREQK